MTDDGAGLEIRIFVSHTAKHRREENFDLISRANLSNGFRHVSGREWNVPAFPNLTHGQQKCTETGTTPEVWR